MSTIDSDLEREKSISLDSSLNEKEFSKKKSELLKTEKSFGTTGIEINENLEISKRNLNDLKDELKELLFNIEKLIINDKKISIELFKNIQILVDKITSAHENY